jgi:hypothetical protein
LDEPLQGGQDGIGDRVSSQIIAEQAMLGEQPDVGVGDQAMAILARTACRPGQLAQQFRVGQEHRPEQRPTHDGQKPAAGQAVQPPGSRVLPQDPEQFGERLEHLPLEDRPEQVIAGLPVQVDGALADVGVAGDVVDGDPPVAVAEQELGGDLEDLRGACLAVAGVAESATGRAHACMI